MEIVIADAVQSTWIIIAVLVVGLIASIRPSRHDDLLPLSVTQELKGLAILAIVFGHIGYFLVDDHRFLFPLSIGAGVGVNLFLFLSGYGLTAVMMKKSMPAFEFYQRRLMKVFIPFWLVLIVFFLMDAFILQRTYSPLYVVRSLLGLFPRADVLIDVNSVFWYITWILLYYLLFPLVFWQRRPWLSAIVMYAIGEGLVQWRPSLFDQVLHLYQVHTVAFPLGMIVAVVLFEKKDQRNVLVEKIKQFKQSTALSYALQVLLAALAGYTAYRSGVGEGPLKEQAISIVTTVTLVALFALKRFSIGLFSLIGFYSYEIYLVHWPLLYRYDVIYRSFPAWLATLLYFVVFIAVGIVIQKLTGALEMPVQKKSINAK